MFFNKYLSKEDFVLHACWFILLSNGDGNFDNTGNSEVGQAYEFDKKMWLSTGKFSKRISGLSLDLLVKKVCGLLLNSTLFRISRKSDITNAAVKLF